MSKGDKLRLEAQGADLWKRYLRVRGKKVETPLVPQFCLLFQFQFSLCNTQKRHKFLWMPGGLVQKHTPNYRNYLLKVVLKTQACSETVCFLGLKKGDYRVWQQDLSSSRVPTKKPETKLHLVPGTAPWEARLPSVLPWPPPLGSGRAGSGSSERLPGPPGL